MVNTDEPNEDEHVIFIDDVAAFEEQFESFKTQLKGI